jgi:phage protein D
VTQLELDWVRERRATLERAHPSVPSETREIEVSAEAFAEYERSAPYRGSAYVWVVRPPEDAPPTSASTDADNEKKEVFRIPCRSKKEADHIAESKLASLSHVRAEGYGEAEGVPTLTAGRTVELAGMGSRFSRNYYVTKATHRIGGSGYRTSFEAKEVPE